MLKLFAVIKKIQFLLSIGISMLTVHLSAQDCSIIAKANDITPDRLCSPVTVNWDVTFRGVNNAGRPVQVKYDWDDGNVEVFNAVNIDPSPGVREWGYTASHAYTSTGDRCNYHPVATLIVDGQVCTSSSQEQIVTVWDTDDQNGGKLSINPPVYPICFGNAANVRFRDVTLFNCVPPQENDVPNLATRWIQWVYGTDITMTGSPVTINGTPKAFPYYGSITTLPGPVTGSGIYSEIMNVANDKLIGQYFEVTLRYWNYCNPYDDPLIPGPPADPVNGDNDPVTTTAIILIVPFPNAKIDPVNPVCLYDGSFHLSAADPGGSWSGSGIVNSGTGKFSPSVAGAGNHIIRYEITDGNSCSDWDTVVVSVMNAPDATIVPAGPLCDYHSAIHLVAGTPSGTWSGTGITDTINGQFDPSIAGPGQHIISFTTLPDLNGCFAKDTIDIRVDRPPDAQFLTPDSAWCDTGDDETFALIGIDGTNDLDYDLIWELNGEKDTIFNISNDSIQARLYNKAGMNHYILRKVIENFDHHSCESVLNDALNIRIAPTPAMNLNLNTDGVCSPVSVSINTTPGNNYTYKWKFSDGTSFTGDSAFVAHTFYNLGTEDTSYRINLIIKTPEGCIDSIHDVLDVYPNPRADFFVSPMIQDFPATEVIINNFSSAGNWNYLWRFGDGNIAHEKQPGGHDFKTAGDFTITLRMFSEFCSDSIAKKIRILPPPPMAAFTPDTTGCSPLSVKFINNSQYAETYLWDFDDGSFSNEKEPVHSFYNSKDYIVKLLVSGVKGNADAKHLIRVFPNPRADFNAYPDSASRTDQVIKFTNTSERAVKYMWDFGDGSFSTDMNPSYVYGKEGTFDISLYVWSENFCPDTITREKYIKVIAGEGNLIFPNVFKWNGSGPTGGYWSTGEIDNTVFHPHFENVVEYKLLIYNRWGELMYTSGNLYKGWDGYVMNGKRAKQGVYVYKAWVKYIDGSTEIKAGDVTFLY